MLQKDSKGKVHTGPSTGVTSLRVMVGTTPSSVRKEVSLDPRLLWILEVVHGRDELSFSSGFDPTLFEYFNNAYKGLEVRPLNRRVF